MKSAGCVQNGQLEFRVDLSGAQHSPPAQDTAADSLEFLRPCAPDARVSEVFDKLCVSGRTWERARESVWSERNAHSLENPTPAMLEVLKMMRNKEKEKRSSGRKRTKRWDKRLLLKLVM